MAEITIEVECGKCNGTGIYHSSAEPEGVGVVCLECEGTGATTLTYNSFTERKIRYDIKTVQRSAGIGPNGRSITYEAFLKGEMP